MKNLGWNAASRIAAGLILLITTFAGSWSVAATSTAAYTITVKSANPASGVRITYGDALTGLVTIGVTTFTKTFPSGTPIILKAPETAGGNSFSSWTGCTTASTVTCSVTLKANTTVTAKYATPPDYKLTVKSASPTGGAAVSAYPADIHDTGFGTTPFSLTYRSGTAVTLTAPLSSGGYSFHAWTGCTTASGVTCKVTVKANTTVTANFDQPSIQSVRITPNPAIAIIGTPLQFTATVSGTGNYNKGVTWSLAGPAGNADHGTLSGSGLYITPFPAPATVTVTATSAGDPTKKDSINVALNPPAKTTGPPLTVNAGMPTHAISPYIYGMNGYALDTSVATEANIGLVRWGGDNTVRYNYLTNNTNSAADYYFLNSSGAGGMWPTGNFNDMVTSAASYGIAVAGTVPMIGWVSNGDPSACSFPVATYPDQQSTDYSGQCGNGVYASSGDDITGNDPTVTSVTAPVPAPPAASAVTTSWADATFSGGWVNYLVNTMNFGPGNPSSSAGKGVAVYDLGNEPAWWDAVHRDVHPVASTYDEVTNGGIATALAVKTVDPTAEMSGPVVDYWWNYFYSKKDIESGWNSGPCYAPFSNPVDREAHNGVSFVEYYLQQFKAAEATYGSRLLDFVDLHTYFAADYMGSSVGLTTAGDTGAQEARLNSTRVFWDPTYTDPNYQQPNYITDPNYTTSCSPPAQAPQLIRMMKRWIAKDYPGTKTAITEYNWGGQENVNGAVAQADILGIFGREGLDMGTLWGPPDPQSQVPGLMAFKIFRNYDGAKSTFGDMALASTSGNQSRLAVYGALRATDNMVTVMVVNKTYGELTATLSLDNLTPNGKARVYQYSNANPAAIVAQPGVTVTPPATGKTTSTIIATFPGQSITLFVVPRT
jgi:hypothetical protein